VSYYIILFAIFRLFFTFSLSQQTPEAGDDIYQKIPTEQRRQLEEAIGKLIAAEKLGDWKSVYALLHDQTDETEGAFVSKMKRQRRLREFRPSKVTFMPPDNSWIIQGCASFAGEPEARGHVADITARWREPRWYLSPIAFVPFGNEKGAQLRECSTEP